MRQYDFDPVICRENTCSIKNDVRDCSDMLCMWVADMDFAVAEPISDAIKTRACHPIYGYSYIPDTLFQSVSAWYLKRQGILYDPTLILPYYSVVSAISLTLLALTKEGDGVTIMAPTYMNFPPAVEGVKRVIHYCPLINNNGIYEVDFVQFEACLAKSKVFLHCSPHNPSGRVWTLSEQVRMAELCEKHHVLVISDEIHSDLIMPGYKHIPFLIAYPKAKEFTVTMLSATKTFNLAHNGMAFIMPITNQRHHQIKSLMDSMHLGSMNIFATTAVNAAYEAGEEWLDQVLAYIYKNYLHIKNTVETHYPKIKILPLEGTYLMWFDCRKLGIPVTELFEKAGHILGEDGILFGPHGKGYYRLNIATSRIIIDEMLHRLDKAYHTHF